MGACRVDRKYLRVDGRASCAAHRGRHVGRSLAGGSPGISSDVAREIQRLERTRGFGERFFAGKEESSIPRCSKRGRPGRFEIGYRAGCFAEQSSSEARAFRIAVLQFGRGCRGFAVSRSCSCRGKRRVPRCFQRVESGSVRGFCRTISRGNRRDRHCAFVAQGG